MKQSRYLTPLLLGLAFFASSCAMSRVSTTKTTAIEQALLAQSTQTALAGMTPPALGGKSFAISREPDLGGHDFKGAEAVQERIFQEQQLSGALTAWLARTGLGYTPHSDNADCLVIPQIQLLGIDDDNTFIGVPAIPVIVPGVGSLSTPQIALFSVTTQVGRAKFGYMATDRKTGAVLHTQSPVYGQKIYKRWQILIFISFRTTDLERPF